MSSKGSPPLYIRLRSKSTGEWFAPPELRERIVTLAREQEESLTDAVVGILAARYRVEVTSSGKRATEPEGELFHISVRLPAKLDTALSVAAARARPTRNRQREAMVVLCEHFGLSVPRPPRRGPVPKV